MTITDDIVKGLRNPTPLYAVAGAADLAAEKLREVPPLIGRFREVAPRRIEKLRATDPKLVQERFTAQAKDAQVRLNETFGELELGELRDLRKLGESVQNAALHSVGRAAEAAVRVRETYDELAERGKDAMAAWRSQTADGMVRISPSAGSGQARPKPRPKPQTKSQSQSKPKPKPKSQPKAQPKPRSQSKPQPKSQPKSQPRSQSPSHARPQTHTHTQTQAPSQPKPKPQTKMQEPVRAEHSAPAPANKPAPQATAPHGTALHRPAQ